MRDVEPRTDCLVDFDDMRFIADVGSAAITHGLPALAVKIFSSLRPFCRSQDTGPLIGLAVAHYGVGDEGQGLDILEEVLQADPHCVDSKLNIALIHCSKRRKDKAQYWLEKVDKNELDNVQDYLYRGISATIDSIS